MTDSKATITAYLAQLSDGNREVLGDLMPLVYEQLSSMARQRLKQEYRSDMMSTQSLVHEAYMDIAGQNRTRWQNRGQFYAVAAIVMRRILVDRARRNARLKHGANSEHVSLDDAHSLLAGTRDTRLLEIDSLLDSLAHVSERAARVVECRFFAGLSIEETAEALGTSPVTVKRDWQTARAWLKRELEVDSDAENLT